MVKRKVNWLFLRGYWDSNNKYNIKNDLDMWCQLFAGLTGNDIGNILLKGKKAVRIVRWPVNHKSAKGEIDFKTIDYVFSRGGYEWQDKIIKKCKNAFMIYYGAGKRYVPRSKIKYDLVLADSESQLNKLRKKGFHAELFFKPAAEHFKPVDVKKKYDCCFVAIHPTDERKNVKWVYKTLPKDLKVLQLGNTPKFKVPKNVKVRKVTLDKMPKMISKCRVLIAPYGSKDSAPRVISEALACGIPVICLDSVRFWRDIYDAYGFTKVGHKHTFWYYVKKLVESYRVSWAATPDEYYRDNLSIPMAAKHLRKVIENGTK